MKITSFNKIIFAVSLIFLPVAARAQADFNPSFIISDPEMQDYQSWDIDDIQKFLDSKGSYLRNATFPDVNGTPKTAAAIIYQAAQMYQINPKFLLVTLQKEQSLVTDDSPSQRQLDWATGYAVCDGCYINDPKVQKYKGFAKQLDGAAGIIRWYYQNQDNSIVKKKDTPIRIDNQDVTPGSWATAFLYTYTPHLHGNANFWRIWSTWFEAVYPNGTLLQSASSSDYWLVENGTRRHFKTKTALVTRVDPKRAIKVNDVDLDNYPLGPEIAFANYSLLQTDSGLTYLLDYDTLRPFESPAVVRELGYNPDELIDVADSDLKGYTLGPVITATTTAPQGVVYKITDANNALYYLKNNILYPITDPAVIEATLKNSPVEKHKKNDITAYPVADTPLGFSDGTLLQVKGSSNIYVIENGKKRPLADEDTFMALGYKKSNIISVSGLTMMNIPTGERIFVNGSLISASNKYLGDSEVTVNDIFGKAKSPEYLVAEYPSGRILSGKNIDTKRPIASLTKLMTAYEALHQDYDLNGKTTFSDKKVGASGKSVPLKNGDVLKNKDVFYTMLVNSNNNAARMVAQATSVGEQGLIDKINLRLEEWGADNTSFSDVSGLTEKNQSTARDLLKIFTKVLEDKTISNALSSASYSFSELKSVDKIVKHTFKNTNQIIANIPEAKRDYKILATKTGYTDEADAVLAMLIENKAKKKYIVITMGNPDYAHRFEEPHKIAEWVSTASTLTLTSKKK